MKFFCRHCEKIVAGQRYRVHSEEDGIILLDMTVCEPCYEQALLLGLDCRAEVVRRPAQYDRRRRRDRTVAIS